MKIRLLDKFCPLGRAIPVKLSGPIAMKYQSNTQYRFVAVQCIFYHPDVSRRQQCSLSYKNKETLSNPFPLSVFSGITFQWTSVECVDSQITSFSSFKDIAALRRNTQVLILAVLWLPSFQFLPPSQYSINLAFPTLPPNRYSYKWRTKRTTRKKNMVILIASSWYCRRHTLYCSDGPTTLFCLVWRTLTMVPSIAHINRLPLFAWFWAAAHLLLILIDTTTQQPR